MRGQRSTIFLSIHFDPQPATKVTWSQNPGDQEQRLHVTSIFLNYISEHLRNSTEVEDALVAQARQVGNNVRDVPQRVSDEQVETGESRVQLLRLGKVLQTTGKLTPGLHGDTEDYRAVCFKQLSFLLSHVLLIPRG